MRFIILFMAFSIMSFQAFAQIAAPSLDPSTSNDLFSLTPWRYHHTIAGNYGSGTMKSNTTGNTFDADIGITGGMVGFNFDGFGIEANLSNLDVEGNVDFGGFKADIEMEESTTKGGISYRFGDSLSLGIGQENRDLTEKMTPVGSSASTEKSNFTATMMSATYRFADVIFVGGGINQYKSTGSDSDKDKEELTWQETVYGIGLLMGEPGNIQFKAEYGIVSSPEKTKESASTTAENKHPKTEKTVIVAEIKAGNYFISYSSDRTKESEIKTGTISSSEKETTGTIIGVGYSNETGLIVSLYSQKETEKDKDPNGENELERNMYVANVGFNF